jgi:hypothetical protein
VGKNLYSLVIMAENVLRGFVRRLGRELALKIGIRIAPATHVRPVEAVVNPEHALDANAYGVPPGAKRVVRVVPGQKDMWIKNCK